jgi:hypothetical protein
MAVLQLYVDFVGGQKDHIEKMLHKPPTGGNSGSFCFLSSRDRNYRIIYYIGLGS